MTKKNKSELLGSASITHKNSKLNKNIWHTIYVHFSPNDINVATTTFLSMHVLWNTLHMPTVTPHCNCTHWKFSLFRLENVNVKQKNAAQKSIVIQNENTTVKQPPQTQHIAVLPLAHVFSLMSAKYFKLAKTTWP